MQLRYYFTITSLLLRYYFTIISLLFHCSPDDKAHRDRDLKSALSPPDVDALSLPESCDPWAAQRGAPGYFVEVKGLVEPEFVAILVVYR